MPEAGCLEVQATASVPALVKTLPSRRVFGLGPAGEDTDTPALASPRAAAGRLGCPALAAAALGVTQDTADPALQLNSPVQTIVPAHLAAMALRVTNVRDPAAGCGLPACLISHFSLSFL